MDIIVKMCEMVGNKLGKGYSENIYQEAICVLLRNKNINHSKEHILSKYFEGIFIGFVRCDITLSNEKIVIECKAIEGELRCSHLPQIITYMELLDYNEGIFVNFNQNPAKEFVEIYRVIRDNDEYKFINDNKNEIIYMDSNGKLIEKNECYNTLISKVKYSENSMLLKSECKRMYEENYLYKNKKCFDEFIEKIEERCKEKFKDKQINGVKYRNVIMNYVISEN
jgi:GxxExxY protein